MQLGKRGANQGRIWQPVSQQHNDGLDYDHDRNEGKPRRQLFPRMRLLYHFNLQFFRMLQTYKGKSVQVNTARTFTLNVQLHKWTKLLILPFTVTCQAPMGMMNRRNDHSQERQSVPYFDPLQCTRAMSAKCQSRTTLLVSAIRRQ